MIPALLWLIERLARVHRVRVFALRQERRPAQWPLLGATVQNVGRPAATLRAFAAIRRQQAQSPFDLVHAIFAGPCALAGVAAARSLGIPSLVHLAGGELVALPGLDYGGRLQPWRRALDDWPLRHANVLTAASAPMIAQARALGFDAVRVPLGVDLSSWPARDPVPRDPQRVARLIHVASLNRVKDQATLLRALQLLAAGGADFHLDIVGEDTLGGRIQSLAAQLGLDERTTFHGFLTQRQLRPLFESAHLNLVSSRHEAGPMVLLEAAVAGVPTVGTQVGHIAEWSPRAAAAVPVGDAVQMARAIGRLLADEPQRLALARAAAKLAIAEDADHTAGRFLGMYQALRP